MPRWTLKLAAFLASLLVGVAAWMLLPPDANSEPKNLGGSHPSTIAANQASQREETVRSVNSEFTDLPDLDEDEPSPPDGSLIEMFEGGIYRRSEIYVKNGQSWLVLAKSERGEYTLTAATASVKLPNSISWPGDEKDAQLSFKTNRRIVFAIRGIDGITSGPATTLFDQPDSVNIEGHSATEELSDGYKREFVLGPSSTTLRTSRGVSKDGTKLAVLVIESQGSRQVIKRVYHVPTDNRDIIGSLHWAGDIDRDGKLDLYISEFNEKGYTRTELYLSSHAKPGDLVGLAAVFAASGC